MPPVPTDRAGLPAHLADAPLGDPSVFWELATDLLAVIGTDGRFIAANPAWLRVLGRRPEDVVGCYPPDLIHPDDLSRTLAARDEHLAPGSVLHDFANRYRHADGTYRWIRWSGHRTGAGWWIIGRDCTDEKARDDAMRRQERHQRALLGALQDGLCAIDARGRIVDVNDRLCAMLDLRREALLGVAPPLPMWPPEDHERFAAQLAEVLATGEPGRLDATLVDAGGRRFPVVVEYAPVAGPAGPGDPVALCTVRDVTQEVAERRRLRRSEARLRAAHRAAHLSGWEWSPDGRELWMSRELPALAGVAVPRSLDDAMDAVPQPYRAELEEGLRAVAAGERDELRLWHPVDVPNPAITWVETTARAERGADGAVTLVRGTTQNVSAEQATHDEARRARDFYQATLDSLAEHVAVLDERGVILTTNARWDALATAAGADPCATGQGANYLAVCDACDDPVAASVADAIRAIIAGRRTGFEIDYPCPTQDGRTLWFHLRALRFGAEGEDGSARVVVQHLDVTAHRSAEREAQLRSRLVDEVTAAVVATDREGHITEWSRGAEELHGWTREEAVGRDVVVLAVAPPDRAAARDAFRGIVEAGRAEVELTLGHRDGTTFPAYVRAAAICDDAGAVTGFVCVSVDTTERVRSERELRSAREYLQAVADSMGEGLCTLDEDGRLTYMNAAAERILGWQLAELAGRDMQEAVDCLHGEDMRVREDAFVRRDGSVVPVECTSSPFETPAGVRGSVIVFSDITERKREHERLAREVEDLTWLTRIRDALEHDRFRLHAQPIIDLSSGAVVQHELLIRMLDEDGSLVAPGLFLPVAERYGVIREIDRWVVGEAVAIAARGIPIELNLSAASIGDRELAGIFERDLEAFGADPSLIVVELTETALLADEDAGCSFVERLASLGCKIALDDFGTGYGGFTYLKRLPVDHLKIDIEFVRDLPRDMASQHVVRAVVNLARGFGQTTVAEGVEDDETLELLRELGVDCAQGYGIGRPAPVEQVFAAWPSA